MHINGCDAHHTNAGAQPHLGSEVQRTLAAAASSRLLDGPIGTPNPITAAYVVVARMPQLDLQAEMAANYIGAKIHYL
jgi:hypothetical protein